MALVSIHCSAATELNKLLESSTCPAAVGAPPPPRRRRNPRSRPAHRGSTLCYLLSGELEYYQLLAI